MGSERYTVGMIRDLLRDRRARRAYVMTKVAVVAAAAAATVPLSWVLGPRAWYGFLLFAMLMAGLTVAVLAIGKASAEETQPEDAQEGGDKDDEASPADPDPAQPVVLPIEDSIDLHPFAPAEIPDVVTDYLEQALQAGFREVRLIHGRGIGVQRKRVRSLLQRHPLVRELHDAPPERGGWGATIAYLDPPPPSQP